MFPWRGRRQRQENPYKLTVSHPCKPVSRPASSAYIEQETVLKHSRKQGHPRRPSDLHRNTVVHTPTVTYMSTINSRTHMHIWTTHTRIKNIYKMHPSPTNHHWLSFFKVSKQRGCSQLNKLGYIHGLNNLRSQGSPDLSVRIMQFQLHIFESSNWHPDSKIYMGTQNLK